MKIFKVVSVVLTLFVLGACNSGESKQESHDQEIKNEVITYTELEKATWLLGAWANDVPNGRVTEFWEKQNDSVYIGQSFFISKGDTLSFESLRLVQEGDKVYYRPTVKGQNQDLPVTFTLTTTSENQLVFENPNHDFPQKIAYQQTHADSLKVEISGLMKNEFKSDVFAMGRVK